MTDFEGLFRRFVQLHPSELTKDEAKALAGLILSDSRSCALLPKSFDKQRDRSKFAQVLTRAYIEEEYAEVLDYRRRLLNSAGRHKRQRAPIIALILYATWIEHTVNVIVIGAARLKGVSGDVDAVARSIVGADFTARVTRIWTQYEAPLLDRTQRTKLIRLMKLRNDMVHYKWIGEHPDKLQSSLSHMRTTVQQAPTLVRYLRTIERQVTTARFRPRVRKLLKLMGSSASNTTI